MNNDITILDTNTTRRTEVREREVTTIEEYEVTIEETFVDVRLPLNDLRLLAACGEGSYVTTAIQEAGNRLKFRLLNAGYNTKRSWGDY